jgi:hypothetical protein
MSNNFKFSSMISDQLMLSLQRSEQLGAGGGTGFLLEATECHLRLSAAGPHPWSSSFLLSLSLSLSASFLFAQHTDHCLPRLCSYKGVPLTGAASANFEQYHIEDWGKHPFVRGSFSSSKVGASVLHRKLLAQVHNPLA